MSSRDGTAMVFAAPSAGLGDAIDILHSSDRTVVTRHSWLAQGVDVVVKRSTGADEKRLLMQEKSILERLQGISGVVQLAQLEMPDGAIAFCYLPGESLAARLRRGPIATRDLLKIALGVARVLGEVHHRSVIHKDVNPSNILVDENCQPTLIDFNIASNTAEERPGFVHQSHMAGTLAYIAPEQTGRTGRPVDHRADLYSLGITLYELCTGAKPFAGDDLLDLVHDHLVSTPLPPSEVNSSTPPMLSAIVMRLLEKEPDRRYQSARGLAHDLAQLCDADDPAAVPAFALAERDFGARLLPPSRLIGRDSEIAALRDALDRAVRGEQNCLFIAGTSGVGKTALINELRPMVTMQRGWFVASKFDQYRQEGPAATSEPLRALGRLLLAEPQERLMQHRESMLAQLGSNAGIGPALLPEFKLLLGEHPQVDVANPQHAEVRTAQATLDLLRGIASAERPVVLVYDDLQWAPAFSLRLFDMLVTGEPIPGLLVVCGYRSNVVDAAHPLTAMKNHWQQLELAVPTLLLHNLPPGDAALLIGEMLRMDSSEAAALAAALSEHTDGNPYDTVELINALRQDDLLTSRQGRWQWDAAAARGYIGGANVVEVLRRRVARLDAPSREILETMACLGNKITPEALERATGLDAFALQRHVLPAMQDGLLTTEQGETTMLRFRHDRVQHAVFESIAAARRDDLRLTLARRLDGADELQGLCAEQYLPCAALISSPVEKRRVIDLFNQAAAKTLIVNAAVSERFLSAALSLLGTAEGDMDAELHFTLQSQRHSALYSLGRLEDADACYASLMTHQPEPLKLVDVLSTQMYSLAHRGLYRETLAMGLEYLAGLGVQRPTNPQKAIGDGLERLSHWNARRDKRTDFTVAEVTDPKLLAASEIMSKVAASSYFADPPTFAWVVLEAQKMAMEHGPTPRWISSASAVPFIQVTIQKDYRGAYDNSRHLLSVAEARQFESATGVARYVFAVAACHWVEPIENGIKQFHQAREGLLRAGDFLHASYTYLTVDLLFDCAPTLEQALTEVETGLTYAARTGNAAHAQRHVLRRRMYSCLRGETLAPGSFSEEDFDETAFAQSLTTPDAVAATYHLLRATASAIFGDTKAWAQHAAASLPLLNRMPGYYITVFVHALHAVALAEGARGLPLADRQHALTELDNVYLPWLRARAADAPMNYLHMVRWVEAERAWTLGTVWKAGAAFDAAVQESMQHTRPWHQALIHERAAQFHLQQGLEQTGRPLMARALELYDAWGATAKVRAMRSQHPWLSINSGLRRAQAGIRSTLVATDLVDLMAVLRASQALSSETSVPRLIDRVGKVLGSLTGASGVQVLVRPDADAGWMLSSTVDGEHMNIGIEQAGEHGLLPLSAVRYVERTGELLVLDDVAADDRFNQDAFFNGEAEGSLLIAPIHNQGKLRAMLVLDNRMMRAAFSAERLDAVTLIAGQLSVSLDNAMLYASLESKVAERTLALEDANRQLETLSLTDALTGLANRRRFNEALDAEWQRAARAEQPLGLVMLDIDFFKKYNDHYGHQGGDACLKLVAAAMGVGLRGGSDLIARYGGEEFVVLLPNATVDGCHTVAERIRAAVQALAEPHSQSPIGFVSISVGTASVIPTLEDKPPMLIESADAALYQAKRNGRNRVERAD